MLLDLYCCRDFRLCGGDKGAMKTDEVCDRPLDPFGVDTPMRLGLYCVSFLVTVLELRLCILTDSAAASESP